MNDLEKLVAEFDSELSFRFRDDMPLRLPGLIVDKTIHINARVPFSVALATLAEEIGHHMTTGHNDITDYNNLVNAKFEVRARRFGYKKLVPIDKLKMFVTTKDNVQKYDIAEMFGIPDEVVEDVINMYRAEGQL